VGHDHPLSDAHRHGSVPVVAEHQQSVARCQQRDAPVDPARLIIAAKFENTFVGANLPTIRGHPAVAGGQSTGLATASLEYLDVFRAPFFLRRASNVPAGLIPEIHTVHEAVSEPHGSVPRMIGLLTVGFAHGEIPCQRCAIGCQNGVTKGA
jgi:hypothetical protein